MYIADVDCPSAARLVVVSPHGFCALLLFFLQLFQIPLACATPPPPPPPPIATTMPTADFGPGKDEQRTNVLDRLLLRQQLGFKLMGDQRGPIFECFAGDCNVLRVSKEDASRRGSQVGA